MSFRRLQQRVMNAETQLQQRLEASSQHWAALLQVGHRVLTPGRVLVTGVVAGFIAGQFKSGPALKSMLDSPRWVRALLALVQAGQEALTHLNQRAADVNASKDKAQS